LVLPSSTPMATCLPNITNHTTIIY
jgi:hypothetical protein